MASSDAQQQTPAPVVVQDFLRHLQDPDVAVAVAVIKALTGVIYRSEASTMMQMEGELQEAATQLRALHEAERDASPSAAARHHNAIATTAGCQLFLRYVTRTFLEFDVRLLLLAHRGGRLGSWTCMVAYRVS
jgi:translation initiation factor eIF-2B subunit alpha